MSLPILRQSIKRSTFIRLYSSESSKPSSSPALPTVKDVGTPDINNAFQQAPNRIAPWSQSQKPKNQIFSSLRFIQKDLSKQPQPYSAMELIQKHPIQYISKNIAVCNGNKGPHQGHPRVYINLDNVAAVPCGYCGTRYAKEEFKDLIESKSS
ncbi:zinc-finger domain-containing protein ASCRUDRAFT_71942 [Ascoidea rubescens DSM 1968]|uniref:Zinc finger CHCC-type domain-containing protein n=1 Tax=Ascoidea rubescens DSM 1968 TaxID=1344418 RepID=A0A1D2VC72_9ASCO|nr:hypothetical protein ASCRUDRAFT_71942 [Ascoidea rubescens DSM 1968]ODV59225.1 hypothetical protein ASCRUDRAFT_71942 [Ascoidea rubescens DSM 1968]